MIQGDIVMLVSGDPNAQLELNAKWTGHVAVMGSSTSEILRFGTPGKVVVPLGRNLSQRRREAIKELLQGADGVPGGTVYFVTLKRPQGSVHGVLVIPRDEKLEICIGSKRR